MDLVKSYLTKNPCYKSSRTIVPKGLMLHSVGVPQPNANVFIKTWDDPAYDRACVHAFIDAKTGVVYQTLPWTKRGWHAGGSANNTHIGVEMCEPEGISYYRGSNKYTIVGDQETVKNRIKTTYDSAVELFASLCVKYKLDPLKKGVVVSHAEGHKLGIATNHGDPEHLWSRASLKLPYTMDLFRRDILEAMKDGRPEHPGQNGIDWPETPFPVHVTIDDLWIRQGPGLQYPRNPENPFTGAGVFTIVERSGNFGRLRSGVGWINLANEGVKLM